MKLIVHHLSRNLALARGLASDTKHIFPYTDATGSMFAHHEEAVKILWHRRCYEAVAIVDGVHGPGPDGLEADLEHAFGLTNSVDKPWHLNKGVVAIAGARRSTSVGDVIEEIKGEHSIFWRVDGVGFKFLARASSVMGSKEAA